MNNESDILQTEQPVLPSIVVIPGASPQNNQANNTHEKTSEHVDSILDFLMESADVLLDSNQNDEDLAPLIDTFNIDEEEGDATVDTDVEKEKKDLEKAKKIADEFNSELLKYFFSKTEVAQEHLQLQKTYKRIYSSNIELLDKDHPVEIHAVDCMKATWKLNDGCAIHQINDSFSFDIPSEPVALDRIIKFMLQLASSTEEKKIETSDEKLSMTIQKYADGFGVKVILIKPEELKEEINNSNIFEFSQAKMMKNW